MWAFPRKPFVDTAVITCRVRAREEERERVAQNLIALVCWLGQATSSELTGHSETTASPSWNIAPACPVCVRDQNKYKLHTNASKQLPCYSTKLVYNGNMVLLLWGEGQGLVSVDQRICKPVRTGLANRMRLTQLI